MIGLIFSLDYEIDGSGRGDVDELMVRPTDELLSLFNACGAKLNIMVEVAEILALKKRPEFQDAVGRIEEQLRRAVAQGHDLQLHLHPAWFNARFDDNRWILDAQEYGLPCLPREKIVQYLRTGKEYLESLARTVRSDYACIAFRASNWLTQPCENLIAALEETGFVYDSSVFKHGHGEVGSLSIDYRTAHSDLFSWAVDPKDINRAARREGLQEIPILARRLPFVSMATVKRLKLQRQLRRRRTEARQTSRNPLASRWIDNRLQLFYPKKFDFCRMTFREMKSFLRYAERRCEGVDRLIPVVAIGHSTEYRDDGSLRRFLEYANLSTRPGVTSITFAECARALA